MLGTLKTTTRFVALAVLAAAALALLPASPPASAGGTVLTVTTTDDVVDAGDGLLSLREAAQAADAGGVSTIVLAEAATYVLATCGVSEGMGSLELELDAPLLIDGNGATVDQTCPNRMFDAGGSAAATLEVRDLTMTSTSTDPMARMWVDLPTVLDGVTVTGALGEAGIVGGVAPLTVRRSTFTGLSDDVAGILMAFGGLVIEDSSITDNTASLAIQAGGLEATDVEIVGNTFTSELMIPINQLDLERVEVRDNVGMPAGMVLAGAYESDPQPIVEPFVVQDSAFVGNQMTPSPSADCCPILGFQDVDAEVTGTSVVGNAGFRFAVATYAQEEEPQGLTVENSTVSLNEPAESDPQPVVGVRSVGPLALRHATIAAHSSAEVVAPTLTSLGSIVVADGVACDVDSTTSLGGNLTDDGSCGFDHADDLVDAGPDYGYDGPDLTAAMPVWTPRALAEGVDLIPAEDCAGDLNVDQIGRERPQGAGCDAGAVELLQPFSDVPPGHPFFDDIEWAASQGIAGGFEDGTYRPSLPVSRQAMAAFLYRMAGEPTILPPTPATFSDVGGAHPFLTEVEWLAGSGIAGGFTDGTFRPSSPVSRQAMAAFLYRRAGEPASTPPSPPTFPDVGAGNPFRTEIEWLVAEGIADGYEDGTFKPANAVSRQATAAFLHRIADT